LRTLASLAHALAVAPSVEEALRALAETLAESDRASQLALVTIDERRSMLHKRLLAKTTGIEPKVIDTKLDHLPRREQTEIAAGGQFADFGDGSDDYAKMLGFPPLGEPGLLAVRGIRFDGVLCGLLALYEPKKLFGVRASDRLAPATVLFELAFLRVQEHEARTEAVKTLEDVTSRVHEEYHRKLADLEHQLRAAAALPMDAADKVRILELERELTRAFEEARRSNKRAEAVEATVSSAVAELEKAHIELHRRSEQLRAKTRTLYLIDRLLTLDAGTDDPRQLADSLVGLIADAMQAERCSLMLRAPGGPRGGGGPDALYIAAARGLAPGIHEGMRVSMTQGVAGHVATTRQVVLVQDVEHAGDHALLQDDYFTSGSFISFPLVYRGELMGVVNLANRAQRAAFVEDDVDRVRLLGQVIALVTSNGNLAERLAGALSV
jgi:hypothetical protein